MAQNQANNDHGVSHPPQDLLTNEQPIEKTDRLKRNSLSLPGLEYQRRDGDHGN
jgi:hypothetical protein